MSQLLGWKTFRFFEESAVQGVETSKVKEVCAREDDVVSLVHHASNISCVCCCGRGSNGWMWVGLQGGLIECVDGELQVVARFSGFQGCIWSLECYEVRGLSGLVT